MYKISIYLLLFSICVKAQNPYPPIVFDRDFGGVESDELRRLEKTIDGGVLMLGHTQSDSGASVSQPIFGDYDYWVVRLAANGNKLWDKRYGGTELDKLFSCSASPDGSFILGGYSFSDSSGNKTQNGWGETDYWILKIDANGVIQWDRDFGGTGYDNLMSVERTHDGGCMLVGYSYSDTSGNRSQPSWGGADYWIVKVDSNGNFQWDKRYGGISGDYAFSIKQFIDGSYLLSGVSHSDSSGDKSVDNWGGSDLWVIKIDSSGNKLWDKRYGSSGDEGNISAVSGLLETTTDGGFFMLSISDGGVSGDKTVASYGWYDLWLLRCNPAGDIVWQKEYGSYNDEDEISDIRFTSQGNLLISSTSYSDSGYTKSENNLGEEQGWFILIDTLGNVIWNKTILTTSHDEHCAATESANGCFWLGVTTNAGIGGNKNHPGYGNYDYFMIKLCADSILDDYPTAQIQSATTQICSDSCISFGNQSTDATSYEWFFQGGNPSYSTDENPTNICYYAPGMYDVTLIAHNGPYSDTTVSTNLIQVYAPPSPIVVQSNDSLLATNVTGSNSYQWFFNGTIISGATNPFYIPTQNGNYSVNVTSAEGCSGESNLSVIIESVDNIFTQNDFQLSPNPTSESFTITMSHQGVFKLSIYNTLGQRVANDLVEREQHIDVSYLPAGVYHVTVEVGNNFYSQRLLVLRP